jgi:hypothetical protein
MVNIFKAIAKGIRRVVDGVQPLAVEPVTWQKPQEAKGRD